jgi:hypothetical protein
MRSAAQSGRGLRPGWRRSASVIAQAALTRPMWLNACGKLPIISAPPTSTSSASRPTSLT